ncbi:taurine dioxygenase [Micromonospora sp. HB375]|uniref:TauD/TfdA dioxygenase family protein n=1 Tax=unclassified Micromonospora TaxID=2617518 RepID=UPI001AE94E51|nr:MULTISPECIES: TauD/TfdA family dioxygenase [unclassified Micromonospora]MBP1782796.1 taurine dioxygenase [Micromonospora sp. HB375]MDH6472250.1 alpha-ketoglutarate-dependent taurine dioxygenase [Micromonospora sp. H404/HB375]
MTSVRVQLDLEPLGPHFGALVHGMDLATATDDEIVALRAALVDRKVLFLRDQHLDDDAQVRLGRRIGELTASHPVVGSVDKAHPEVYALDSTDNGFADVWHTDVTFMKRPPLGSMLRPVTLPPTGGDTNWADAQLAYDSLSEPVRRLVDHLTAVHDGTREFGYYLAQRGGNVWEGQPVSRLDPVEHPVVRVHPETGRRGIFVNPGFTSHIVGVSDVESRAILDLLYAHLTKPEHIVRHRWRLGDVALWDNRSTAHYANRDYGSERRVMHRITLRGDIPRGPQDQPQSSDS